MYRIFYLVRLGAIALALSAFGGAIESANAQSNVLERAIQGAIGGAVVGGVTRGKKGIGPGVAIGAAAGAAYGAIEEDRRRNYRKRAYESGDHARPISRNDPLVYDIQAGLTQLGYEPGPVDGAYGPRTSEAIAEYQKENGLLVTGTPSEALLAHVNKQGG